MCFFLKILWFIRTLPVLLQCWCFTCLLYIHTLTPRVRNILISLDKNTIFNEHPVYEQHLPSHFPGLFVRLSHSHTPNLNLLPSHSVGFCLILQKCFIMFYFIFCFYSIIIINIFTIYYQHIYSRGSIDKISNHSLTLSLT